MIHSLWLVPAAVIAFALGAVFGGVVTLRQLRRDIERERAARLAEWVAENSKAN